MLLLSDGTVFAHNGSSNCYRLTPDIYGSYANGTWSALAAMHDTRLYYSSAILRDGKVFVAGGEYGTGRTNAETYDPLANTWTMAPPSGQEFADSISKILPDGNVLIAPANPSTFGGTIIYNPASNVWIPGPTLFRGYSQAEASWVKLSDNSIITIDPFDTNSERYIPSLNQWIDDDVLSSTLYDTIFEIGAGLLLQDGRAFFLGANGRTAFYTSTGTMLKGHWTIGPTIPNNQGAPDAPAAVMINGKILCAVSPQTYRDTNGNNIYPAPTSFYEYDPILNSFQQTSGPTGLIDNVPPYVTRMLDLPDGTVLYANSSRHLYIYEPDGLPLPAGKPTISSISVNLDGSYHLTGTRLNGISEGAGYGDDAQMDSNYPLVRMKNLQGKIYYARTFNWSSTGLMTGEATVSVEFALPANLAPGEYSLVAVANGNSSDPINITLPIGAAPKLSDAVVSNGMFRFTLGGLVGNTYVVQRSLDLINWIPFSTNILPPGGFTAIADPFAMSPPMRFYRATLRANGNIVIPATSGIVTAPFIATNDYLYQAIQTTVVSNGGLAQYNFTIANPGKYLVYAMVNASNSAANSFFVNIDGEPQSPGMIWDIPVTSGFEIRNVSWRGNGTDTSNQFSPKLFDLPSGQHQLLVRGREANTLLQSVTISPTNLSPVVSVIGHDVPDVDPGTAGVQVYENATVHYSGTASDPEGDTLTWEWLFSVNGGPEVLYQNGSGAVVATAFNYGAGTVGNGYVWTLRVSDGQTTAQSQLIVSVEAPVVPAQGGLTIQATNGVITAPFVASNGYVFQTIQTTAVTNSGRAVYNFTTTNVLGNYVIQVLVNAPNTSADSFFVNVDSEPTSPTMIWDVPNTSGFELRTVNWRGNGTDTNDQFVPKVFILSPGQHQLIIRGREANAQLQSITILFNGVG